MLFVTHQLLKTDVDHFLIEISSGKSVGFWMQVRFQPGKDCPCELSLRGYTVSVMMP